MSLQKLADNREAILLAEAIGWLHDYRKCSEEQLKVQSANPTGSAIGRNELTNHFCALGTATLTIPSVTEPLPDLLNKWKSQWNVSSASILMQYLSRCHNTAHFDKQDPYDTDKQNYPGTQISTAFGFESPVGTNLTNNLWTLPWNDLTHYNANYRNNCRIAVQKLFQTIGADTRRPINEIRLWDWGLLVGAFYKTAIVSVILGYQPSSHDLRWQLLSIRTDGLSYLASVTRLADFISRQKILKSAFDKVQTLLEETYPIATEVYRDENGSLFVVPNLPHTNFWDDLCDSSNQTLREHIQQEFETDGDVVPKICLDATAWWGQDPNRTGNDQFPPAGQILAQQTSIQSNLQRVITSWQGKNGEICPICGLRPCMNKQVDYCNVCGSRRQSQVSKWIEEKNSTIWLDEVADGSGRLALLTGTFDLSDWLNGKLVETMLVRSPNPTSVTKTPSFARLHRVWRTTHQFWQETQIDINSKLSDSRRRLKIALANQPALSQHHLYELDLFGSRMSMLWDGAHLISTDNLDYIAIQLNISDAKRKSPADAALEVGLWLEQNKENKQGQKQIFRLISDDEKKRFFDIQIADINYQDNAYSTTIPILSEPRTFMALVPANKALEIVEEIKLKYEREMGKVRNRLPLHLGVVYAHRRTPLRTVLDAGRRMLKQKGLHSQNSWQVVDKPTPQAGNQLPNHQAALQIGSNKHFDQWVGVKLEQGKHQFTWYVPAVMGDGVTPDNWYPYVFVETGGDDSKVSGRARAFKGLRPTASGTEACWLVHAADLEAGDKIAFTAATFDFEWLDTSARRFEIAYHEEGKRLGRLTRPYLLDDLSTIRALWEQIGGKDGLTNSQIYALRDLVESKRSEWEAGNTFEQLCESAVENAEWGTGNTFEQLCESAVENAECGNRSQINLDFVKKAVISGLFADMVELYIGVMKGKPARSKA